MKNALLKLTNLSFLMIFAQLGMAQSNGNSSSYLPNLLLAIGLLVFFGLFVTLADNLLAIQAKKMGVDKDGVNLSLFPRLSEIFGPKLPAYAKNGPATILKKGHDILLEGAPGDNSIERVAASAYAVQPPNFIGISPIIYKIVIFSFQTELGRIFLLFRIFW